MEKSFTSWRESSKVYNDSDDDDEIKYKQNILVYDSDEGSESDIVASSSNSQVLVPDSDESFNSRKSLKENSDKKRESVIVPDSDDQESSDESIKESVKEKSNIVPDSDDQESSDEYINGGTGGSISSTPKLTDKEEFSPVITSARSKPKKPIISSDDEDTSDRSLNFTISDVISEDDNDDKASVNKASVTEEVIRNSPEYHITDDEYSPEIAESPPKINKKLETSKTKPLPTIDLTNTKEGFINIEKGTGLITISSDSEDDKLHSHEEKELNDQMRKVNISKDGNITSFEEKKDVFATGAAQKNSTNDYSSRLESLKAEQIRLDAQVKEVLKNIDTVKSTLKTANMAALPDRGVRLQVNLKKFESQLRDLRYQQNTISNEVIKLQLMPNTSSVPKPIQSQTPHQMFRLPTTTTDINAMGKRALETHRTQQALTVDALRALHKSLMNCPTEGTEASDPAGLKVELMPHQKYALSWLLWREREKPSGGILADDMGLGKTLTMISLILKSNEEKQANSDSDDSDEESKSSSGSNWLSSHRSKLIPGKTLVVCPASLIGQWEGEANRMVRRGTIDVLVHHGQSREKKARRLAKPDLVITTYNIVSRDFENPESPLFQIKWERVILDEAHQIRNHKTKTAQSVFHLKARSRWVLTGTPVHNKELDLYSLIRFLRCSPFDDLTVWKAWVDNRDAAGKQRLNTIMKSIMLRRTKKGLQEVGELRSLPDKQFHTVMIKMDEEEWAVYEKILNFSKTLFATFLHQKAEKENALQGVSLNPRNLQNVEDPFKDHPELARLHRQMKEITDVKSHHILMLLLRLRQFCCHPSLIQSMLEKEDMSNVGIEDSDGLDIDLMDKLTRMSIGNEKKDKTEDKIDMTAMDKDNPLFSKDRKSSKLKKVLERVEDILTSNDKLLIVSQWVSYLDIVHSVLQEKKIKCLRLTGQVAIKDRAEIVEKFNRKDHGPRVLLLSLTAGGVGLNLVGANHLLLLDLHWNPQLENQACDRIYRVGQEKDVQIHKFVTSETVEESVLKLQEKKVDIADSVLTGAKLASSKLTLDDLKMLFKLK